MIVRETKDLVAVERPYSGAITLRKGIHTLIGDDAAVCWVGGNRIKVFCSKMVPVATSKEATRAKVKTLPDMGEFHCIPITLTGNRPGVYIGKKYMLSRSDRSENTSVWAIQAQQAIITNELLPGVDPITALEVIFINRRQKQ